MVETLRSGAARWGGEMLYHQWPRGGASPRQEASAPLWPLGPLPRMAHPLREEAWLGLAAGLCGGLGCLESVEAAQEEATEGGRREARGGES